MPKSKTANVDVICCEDQSASKTSPEDLSQKLNRTRKLPNDEVNEGDGQAEEEPGASLAKKTKSTDMKKVVIEYEDDDSDEAAKPDNWEILLNNIREMRKDRNAPVDTMGCHTCHDKQESPKTQRYQTLISLMLSSQTKDEVTHAAMGRLKAHGLTVDNILDSTDDETLGKLIYPVGFWKKKIAYIKKATEVLRKDYNSDIPKSIEGLVKLPGVGPKMAHICMSVAWGTVSGIGVDTHVDRISRRLGWVPEKKKGPEGARCHLESWLPRSLWSEVNHLLVGFGQTVCKPMNPSCSTCLNKDICPSSNVRKPKIKAK